MTSLGELSKAFAAIEGDVEADVDGTNTEVREALSKIIEAAMHHEQGHEAELADLLSKIARSSASPVLLGLVLNNLGCVEKRRGNLKVALHHLRRAADAEGGIVAASPSTLLNLSAVYAGLKMYAEAAAVSNHAVGRCESDVQRPAPLIHAAALYNLASALEGSGELAHAEEAYKRALEVLDAGNVPHDAPQRRATRRAVEQLDLRLRNERGNADRVDWAHKCLPSLIRKAANKTLNINNSSSNNSRAASRTLQPLRGPHGSTLFANTKKSFRTQSQQQHSTATAADNEHMLDDVSPIPNRHVIDESPMSAAESVAAKSATSERTPGAGSASNAVRDLSVASSTHSKASIGMSYTASVRKFHVFPINSKEVSRSYQTHELQDWDTNPFLASPGRKPVAGADPEVERHVRNAYVPYNLVPFVAALKYKEHTRRTKIIDEHRALLDRLVLVRAHEHHQIVEDEDRVEIEIEELRARKVLLQWARGRVVFVQLGATLDAAERDGRLAIVRELQAFQQSLIPRAQQLVLQGLEEVARSSIVSRDEPTAFLDALVHYEAAAATMHAMNEAVVSRAGLAHGLALWCMEGCLSPAEAESLANPLYLSSHMVMMRHYWFGKPKVKQ